MRHALVELLQNRGTLTTPAVAVAFECVPREPFLPGVAAQDGLDAVYCDQPIVTRRDARGMPVSSSSQPSIMAAMLDALAVQPGQRVLEVGTGTGYNAALLARLVGPSGRVVSVELDPELVTSATDALQRGGHPVEVEVGDGRAGWPPGAPYDRIIVTASGPNIPRAWFDQLVEGGLVVVPLWLRGSLQSVVVLRRSSEGFESIKVIPGGFMALRGSLAEEPPLLHDQLSAHDHVGPATRRPMVSISGPALRHLQPAERRRLLALALGPPRSVSLPVPANTSDLRGCAIGRSRGPSGPPAKPARAGNSASLSAATPPSFGRAGLSTDALSLFVTLTADNDHLVEWYGGPPSEGGPGVAGRAGNSLAVLGRGPLADHLEAWGEVEAEEVLAGLIGRWEEQGRPGRERLRVRVSYDVAAPEQPPSPSAPGVLSFDWV